MAIAGGAILLLGPPPDRRQPDGGQRAQTAGVDVPPRQDLRRSVLLRCSGVVPIRRGGSCAQDWRGAQS
eukprot:264394-Pyramimonas_sp.AAC.1